MHPKLVLLPGLDGTGDLFGPLLAALDADVRPLVIRYRTAPLTRSARGSPIVDIDAPHMLLQAAPRECADVIAGFVRQRT
jgi:hypothetical protein